MPRRSPARCRSPSTIPTTSRGPRPAAAAAGAANQVLGAAPSIIAGDRRAPRPVPAGRAGAARYLHPRQRLSQRGTVERAPDVLRADLRHQQPGRSRHGHRPGADGQRGGVHEAVGRGGQMGRELGERRTEQRPVDARVQLRQVQETGQRLCARSCRDDAGCVHRTNGRAIREPDSRRSMPMAIRPPITGFK